MTIKIEEGKPYMTKGGLRWCGYSYYAGGDHPIHGAFQLPNGRWQIGAWTKEGKHLVSSEFDLMPTPRHLVRERWINVYELEETLHPDKYTANADSAEAAAVSPHNKRLACVRVMIECHEGDGLEPEEL